MFLRRSALAASALTATLLVTACSSSDSDSGSAGDSTAADGGTVSVETHNGAMEVPVNPTRVVALDNTSFETLRDWGVEPVAVPKDLLPDEGFEEWMNNDEIGNVGTHREPNLEVVAEAEPDLIVGGYRFGEYTEELEELAPVVDLSGSTDYEGGFVESLKHQTTELGKIFDKQSDAEALVSDFDESLTAAADATNGESVFLAVVSGGRIDNGAERMAAIIEPLDLTDVFAGDAGDVHGDSGLSPETVAQANPDWAFILDRDAAVEEGDAPAEAIFEAQEAFDSTTFDTEGNILVLDKFFYTRESLQAYGEAYDQVATDFAS